MAQPTKKAPKTKRELSESEAALVARHIQRKRGGEPAPRLAVIESSWVRDGGNAVCQLGPEAGADPLVLDAKLCSAFGTTEAAIYNSLLGQLVNVLHRDTKEPISAETINAGLAMMYGLAPQDEAEAMLAVQMVATHNAAMELLRRTVKDGATFPGVQGYGNLAVKFLRNFAAQTEALARLRGKISEQKVTVEHVHVHSGGQAVVGAVSHRGGPGRKDGK